MSSAQIAQMHGSFQGQSMNQMAYSGMIGGQSQHAGERMAGSAMNTMGAIGAPAAMGGLAVAGLDPFSMAISGGARGFAAGGLAGAGTGALAAGGVAGAGIMAAGFAGGQFMQGAQQHQQLGSNLRSSFNFRNQVGGNGFTGGQVGQIGSMMRDMSQQQGPGGEMVNFDELGRLASNMGRMGMAQGVRNAKEFTEKFKSMVSSLKEIATEMGTSLEEAQKMMAGMKQSGVFGNANQVGMAKAIRAGASAGGMATSELTGMASVGSQISRMVGGKGSAGAEGAVDTITNIGVAQQMGILSEEDIYNQTGQTGAMGRRAMAAHGMQRAARFYKSGMGRRMLAAMAGKDGKLDEDDADEIEGGGVSVNRTRQMWKENMKGVGRANFIRNEGRLRGEALKRFGATGPSMWMKGLMEQKGINVDEDEDKAMLFLQRRMKMGRDEADNELKMIKNLPAIMRERSIVAKEDAASQKMAQRQKGVGIEGLKRKFDSAVADVKGDIQQLGADSMEELSNEFEGVINWLTNTRVKTFRKDAVRSQANLLGGGESARKEFASVFGAGGAGMSKAASGLISKAPGKSQVDSWKGKLSDMLGMGGGFSQEFERDREQLSKSGYDVEGGMSRSKAEGKLRELRSFAEAAAGPGKGIKLGEGTADGLNAVYSKIAGKKGLARAAALEEELNKSDNPELRDMGKLLGGASGAEKGKIIAGIGKAAGREGEGANYKMPDSVGVYDTSEYLTHADEAEDIGRSLMGGNDDRQLGQHHLGRTGVSKDVQDAMGDFAKTDAGRKILRSALSADSSIVDGAKKEMQKGITELENKSNRSVTEEGELNYLKRLRSTQRVIEAGGDKKKLASIAKQEGFESVEELEATAGSFARLARGNQREALASLDRDPAKKRLESMRKAGSIDDDDKLTDKVDFEKGAEADFVTAMLKGDEAIANFTDETRKDAVNTRLKAQEDMDSISSGMSVSQKRQLAKKLRKSGQRERAADMTSKAGFEERLSRGGKGRQLSNLTGMLGSDMSRKDIRSAMEEGGPEELQAQLMEDMGLQSDANKKALGAAIKAQSEGRHGDAREEMQSVMSSKEFKERKDQKEKDAAAAKNPLQVEANTKLQTISELLEQKLGKSLSTIASNTSKALSNSEDWNPLT